MNSGDLKSFMASLVKKLYDLGVVDASFIGQDSTPIMANTSQKHLKAFSKSKYAKAKHFESDLDCALGVHTAANRHNLEES